METIINPTTNPATIVRDDDRHHHDHGISKKDAIFMSAQNTIDQLGRNALGIKDLDIHGADRFSTLSRELCGISRDLGTAIERNGRSAELATEKTGAASQLATALASKDTQVSMALGFKDSIIDSAKNAAAAQLALAVGFKDALIDSTKNAAAVALANAQNTAAILAAQAECCCELKELVRGEADKTRDLVNGLNTTSLERQLSDAKQQISLLQIGIKIPV